MFQHLSSVETYQERVTVASPYLNRLSPQERKDLVTTLHNTQVGKCFICGEELDLILHADQIDIDHIEPLNAGGKDGPDNFALAHSSCNRSKQAADLRVARVLASFTSIAKSIEGENRSPHLGDILHKYEGSKYDLPVTVEGDTLKTSFAKTGKNDVKSFPIYEDGISGFRSSFLELPIEYLHHDDHINPRAIGSNLRKLVVEFHKKLPQLHVSLGWIDTSQGNQTKVQIFDGQHKAAAQILLGARSLPVRVFIDPNTDILLTANTNAGTTLRQVAFDKSVQSSLGSSILQDRIDRYRQERGMASGDESFSERDLVNHFRGENRSTMRRYVVDRVRDSITNHPDNKLRDYVERGGRGTQKPLSYSTIEKTFYQFFIYGDVLATPFNYRFEEGQNPRQLEIDQIVRLMNIIADKIYVGQFDPQRGTSRIESDVQKGIDVDEPHLRAFRMSKEEIIHNWLQFVRRVVRDYFIHTHQSPDEEVLFQQEIPESCWENVENFIDSLARLPVWVNKDLALTVFGSKQNNNFWRAIFTTGRTPDGRSEVMAGGLNLMEMIQPR